MDSRKTMGTGAEQGDEANTKAEEGDQTDSSQNIQITSADRSATTRPMVRTAVPSVDTIKCATGLGRGKPIYGRR